MEKSIETIWKEGFLQSDNMVVPKVNNLYNQKSLSLVEKLKRTFRINIIALVVMSLAILVIYHLLGATWQGASIAIMFVVLAGYSWIQVKSFETSEGSMNSYDYLKSIDRQIKLIISKNILMMRFFYPLVLFFAMSTIWSSLRQEGEDLLKEWALSYPDLIYVGSYPLIAIVGLVVILGVMVYFSDKIYRFDVKLIYGKTFKKIEQTIAEMEALKGGV
ncbi:MAG: hypothetical protein ABJN36_10455 [Cyclobacteriaceae bacterium]